MKKQLSRKRLDLTTETLRLLANADLEAVQGGADPAPRSKHCSSYITVAFTQCGNSNA